jgi:plasmid stability protein
MPDLLVRGVDENLVRSPKERAGLHGVSAEAEHRAILAAALRRPQRRSFAEVLASWPNVGLVSDFERLQRERGTTADRRRQSTFPPSTLANPDAASRC